MLRRVARVLRLLLVVLGVGLVVWLPPSWFYCAWVSGYWYGEAVEISTQRGALNVRWNHRDDNPKWWPSPIVHADFIRTPKQTVSEGFVPSYYGQPSRGFTLRMLSLPLWLLAFLCLAWPVTSFLLARRRRGRGFPVEAKPSPSTPPPSREVTAAVAAATGADGEGGE